MSVQNASLKGNISVLFFIDVFFELWIYIVVCTFRCTFRAINHFQARVRVIEPVITLYSAMITP